MIQNYDTEQEIVNIFMDKALRQESTVMQNVTMLSHMF